MARVLFITGFNRSGTTLVTSAVTQAARGRTLTVGDLARHMPSVQRFLAAASRHGTVTDRGVDRLPVTESTPEEYGWLLNAVTGDFAFGTQAAQAGVLHSLVDELAGAGDATVVLKNPADTGRERLLLDSFAGDESCWSAVISARSRTARAGPGTGWPRPTGTCVRCSATPIAGPSCSGRSWIPWHCSA